MTLLHGAAQRGGADLHPGQLLLLLHDQLGRGRQRRALACRHRLKQGERE
jgi:hypothetical protein